MYILIILAYRFPVSNTGSATVTILPIFIGRVNPGILLGIFQSHILSHHMILFFLDLHQNTLLAHKIRKTFL